MTDQVVLITGAGRGLGRALAMAFAHSGAIVAANDITPINLDETMRQIRSAGGQVKDYVFDVAKRLPTHALVEQVLNDWGRLDILINNAAVQPQASVLEMDEWDWHRTLDVNLSGPFFAIQRAAQAMQAQGGGVILCIGDAIADDHDAPHLAGRAAYTASKAALAGLVRVAAAELAPSNIRVNLICPGPGPEPPNPLLPAGCRGATAVALFLCSPAAASISGQTIYGEGSNK